jgi:uracil-DNA glycosylase family 4
VTPSKEWAHAALRQLQEAGLDDVYLGGMTREQALARSSDEVGLGEASAVSPDLPAAASPEAYEQLKTEALGCTRCALAGGRTQVVFSDGHPNARLMVVGEAPGQREDETGVPFVGRSGQMLDLLLGSVGLSRKDSVYICNVLKCRPPGNRNPLPDEIDLCSPFLLRQIELVKPEAILAVGTFAAQLLSGQPIPIGKLRGNVYSYGGAPLVVTYHPAALLRNQSWTRKSWDDLQLLIEVMDGRTGQSDGAEQVMESQ